MAGIYIHVPFCKTRCAYCDFFTQTDTAEKSLYPEALGQEIELRCDYLNGEIIDSIYFGGGTPSQLSADEIHFILEKISGNFTVNPGAEITLEANPDDLDKPYLELLLSIGINRLSIGIQSFNDNLLHFLNRRHSAQKAV
ncbi:MAG TPA: coproporphyrinogen III oxidase, partial [Dysgonomonas sp.]|nr:coproporphyrinogen III oxidase [Dysgonomonas sp.]